MKSFRELTEQIGQHADLPIDLHMHTCFSDGTLTPEELVARAKARGMQMIALTDHDGVGGLSRAVNAGEQQGVLVIPGIELSAAVEPEELPELAANGAREAYVHMLGYQIDPSNEALLEAISRIRAQRKDRNEKLLAAVNRIGYQISEEDLHQHEGQDYIGKPNFAVALMKKGYIAQVRDAFLPGQFLRDPEVRKVHREKIDAKEAIRLIHGAGGYAVLAHPYKIGALESRRVGYFDRLEIVLNKLQEWGLDGMECRYSSHTEEMAGALLRLAKKKSLMTTAGSDFHGPEFDQALDIGVTLKKEATEGIVY